MKKIIMFLIALCFLTGCSKPEKELVCSKNISIVDLDIVADYENNKIMNLSLKYTMDLSLFTGEQIKTVAKQNTCLTAKEELKEYTDTLTNCKQHIENKVLFLTADFNLNKIKKIDINKDTTIEQAKKVFEKENYTCVINDLLKK